MTDRAADIPTAVDAWLDGIATDTDFAALDAWLAADPANAHGLMDLAVVHHGAAVALRPAESPARKASTDDRPAPQRVRNWAIGSAVAAALLVACGVAIYLIAFNTPVAPKPDPFQPGAPVATLIESTGKLTTPHGYPAEGEDFSAGEYALDSGTAEFMLTNAVNVKLRGETRLHMRNNMNVVLASGSAEFKVPRDATGFTVHLPDRTRIVDLGTAFRVEINEAGLSEVEVTAGAVEVYPPASPESPVRLKRGEFAVITDEGRVQRFPNVRKPIHLGNLFDDDKFASLAEALSSDAMAATADDYDLGVYTVAQGADAVQEIAPDVWMDFRPLGWAFAGFGSVGNDAWTGERGSKGEAITGIRTTGKTAELGADRHEQGVGMHADAVIVFDLDELRRAGHVGDLPMRFVVDRAGYNDDALGAGRAVHMIVAVTHADGSVVTHVNGEHVELRKDGNGVWQIAKHRDPIRSDGKPVAFDIPLAPNAEHLALVVTGGGDGIGLDHAVFSGARIVIEPNDQEKSHGKDRAKD